MPRSASRGRIVVQLAEPHERLAADDRDVQRTMFVDELKEAVDELLPLEVADLAKRDVAAEVFVTVGVTAGAASGHSRVISIESAGRYAGKDSSPRGENPSP